MHPRQIYAITLRKLRSYMVAHGVDLAALLAGTEIYPSDLDDPYRQVSEAQARLFYRNALDLTEDKSLGLEIGWTTNMAELGPLGLLHFAARTVREAVQDGAVSYETFYALVDYGFEDRGDTPIFRFHCRDEDEALRIFLLERTLGMFQGICEDLVGQEAHPLKVLLDYKAPVYAKRYEEIFRCPVHFEQPRVEMHFPKEYLDRELESYDPQARDALKVLQSSLLSKLSSHRDIVNEVKMVLRRKAGEFPRLEEVADKLAMSPRTLRRKLGAAHLRYQDLLDRERRKVAEDYLANSDLTVQQIAEKCDFNDAQNFSKAFKRWSGVSPTDYRKSSKT